MNLLTLIIFGLKKEEISISQVMFYTINELNCIKRQICELLKVTDDILYIIEEESKYPYINYEDKQIHIIQTNDWRIVYQLSHELLHYAFMIYSEYLDTNYIWFEEILCEAFSIYCLEQFCDRDYDSWYHYLSPNMYYLEKFVTHENAIAKKSITLIELNEMLKGFKSYEIRQFIHPLALRIKAVINNNFSDLTDCLNYTKFITDNKLQNIKNNKIVLLINDFIETSLINSL